ncbi:MAG: CpaD family pilus assembly protein [Alphaproteobacteria bacterium]|nr:CpaD family pilus assembly protein [Alphaproteobacteria bacterium]
MTNFATAWRLASIAAVILAGSCAPPMNDGSGLAQDGAVNHPISVEPHYTSIKLSFSAPNAGLLPDDTAKLSAFVADYLSRGNGAISVTAPSGPGAAATLSYFGERLFDMGVPRSRILVGTHEASQGGQVEIGYIAYEAHTAPCGDWSASVTDTSDNRTSPNFGCAVQQNIAAQIADPRDLIQPRESDAADAVRRATVMDNYEKGKVTSSDKTQDQSGKVSEVGQQ